MKLRFVDICGFRGFRRPLRIDFADSITVIEGPNGAGKSTIFDAVEFALTGTISKYIGATAARESVEDYIWWNGEGDIPEDHYVAVEFTNGSETYSIRRTPGGPVGGSTRELMAKLVDMDAAPKDALIQLCATSIIRDEHISRLSLDLKETERFDLMRNAVGAVDAGHWIRRSTALMKTVDRRFNSATQELHIAKGKVSQSARQIDQTRSELPTDDLVARATSHLQSLLRTNALSDEIGNVARQRLSGIGERLSVVRNLMVGRQQVDMELLKIPTLEQEVAVAQDEYNNAKDDLARRESDISQAPVSVELSQRARQLESLVSLGQEIGLRNGRCPLCESTIADTQFERGLEAALAVAREFDARAVEQARQERAIDQARDRLDNAQVALVDVTERHTVVKTLIADYSSRLENAGLPDATVADLEGEIGKLETEQASIVSDLGIIEATYLNQVLEKVIRSHRSANERVKQAEIELGRRRLGKMRAKAIHDAVRRASGETLDQRLDRVLPLMSELYKRLRPHPFWNDIEYRIRGDVRRFLRLQVGDDVNPQFVFSSGQRRATGIAFLLSINLSISWSRWRSILLDDPVQHVDDFRAIHLAEVLGHLCEDGRQVICAVEDSSLAGLMCRRVATSGDIIGKRVTLGTAEDGALTITATRHVDPLTRRVLVNPREPLTA